jgi:hypothetical protein
MQFVNKSLQQVLRGARSTHAIKTGVAQIIDVGHAPSFSALGWPEEQSGGDNYSPTSVQPLQSVIPQVFQGVIYCFVA